MSFKDGAKVMFEGEEYVYYSLGITSNKFILIYENVLGKARLVDKKYLKKVRRVKQDI